MATQYEIVKSGLEKSLPTLRDLFGGEAEALRAIRAALVTIKLNPALLQCTQESLFKGVFEAAQLGLVVDGIGGDAHLIPFGNKATMIPGYQGLIRLAKKSGKVADIYAAIVYEDEEFTLEYGENRRLSHTPKPPSKRGERIVGAYAVAVNFSGPPSWVWMWREEIEKIRDNSPAVKAGKQTPWKTHPAAMFKKTCVRQLKNWVTLSPEFSQAAVLSTRDEYDGGQDMTIDVGDLGKDPAQEKTDATAEGLRDRLKGERQNGAPTPPEGPEVPPETTTEPPEGGQGEEGPPYTVEELQQAVKKVLEAGEVNKSGTPKKKAVEEILTAEVSDGDLKKAYKYVLEFDPPAEPPPPPEVQYISEQSVKDIRLDLREKGIDETALFQRFGGDSIAGLEAKQLAPVMVWLKNYSKADPPQWPLPYVEGEPVVEMNDIMVLRRRCAATRMKGVWLFSQYEVTDLTELPARVMGDWSGLVAKWEKGGGDA